MYMCMLKLKYAYLKYFKYAAKPTAGACMALAICDDGDDDMPALEAYKNCIHCSSESLCARCARLLPRQQTHTNTNNFSPAPPEGPTNKSTAYKLSYFNIISRNCCCRRCLKFKYK
jgi:hypothetical protein